MAVEAAVAWYEELREKDEMQASISKEIARLSLSMREMEFSKGFSKAELLEKRAKVEKERDALGQRYQHLIFERWSSKPDFSGMTEAERAEAAERLRINELQYARRLMEEGNPRGRWMETEERIIDFDPKQGGRYYTRLHHVYDLASFDLDEESPIPPMRFTDVVYKNNNDYELCEAVNILSVKMGSLVIDFPIHVYGTVIVRDSLDKKCVYLFRRDREDSQTINSKDESLILTGPKRGLALISDTYVETNLMIKGDDEFQQDRELSKGILTIQGIARRMLKNCELESCSLATRLSTVDVVYAVVKDAVEATISVEVLAGEYFGEITVCTSSIKNRLVLHDNRLTPSAGGQNIAPVIQLLRSVVAVYVKEKLSLTIAAHTDDGEITKCIDYTPRVNGSNLDEITVGATTLSVRVVWSIIDF